MADDAKPQTPLEIAQHAEILELESQIRSLNTKISAAVDHAADLQEIIRTRQKEDQAEQAVQEALANESSLRRMSTYFSRRPPGIPHQRSTTSQPSSPTRVTTLNIEETDLRNELEREKNLRKEIEAKFQALQDESELLSQSLFEEANRMVSVEKQATHTASIKLKALQDRELERRDRILDLQRAVDKIQHVRSILAQPPITPAKDVRE